MTNKRATLIGLTVYVLIVVFVVGKLARLLWQVFVVGNGVTLLNAAQWIDTLFFGTLIPIVYGGVAALIVARRPGHAVGWLLFMPALAGAIPTPSVSALLDPPAQPGVLFYLGAWFFGWAWLPFFLPVFCCHSIFRTAACCRDAGASCLRWRSAWPR